MSTYRFFVHDNEGGFDLFETASEAETEAETRLSYERDEAPDGWSENTDTICWGVALGRVIETERKSWVEHIMERDEVSREKAEADGPYAFDTYVDYDLRKVDIPDSESAATDVIARLLKERERLQKQLEKMTQSRDDWERTARGLWTP
ncbi:MAG: hypothetical protein GY716_15930 [bacterium]|nr:hypothetical protein [bacterium]